MTNAIESLAHLALRTAADHFDLDASDISLNATTRIDDNAIRFDCYAECEISLLAIEMMNATETASEISIFISIDSQPYLPIRPRD